MSLEADGVLMSRARLQLLRPASVRVREAVSLHYGSVAELPVTPALVPVDTNSGREISVVVHNNAAEIRNFVVEAAGRRAGVFAARARRSQSPEAWSGMCSSAFSRLRVKGGLLQGGCMSRAQSISMCPCALPSSLAVRRWLIPPTWMDDGQPEWVLENQRARATFSAQDGGRWLEFVWKDSGFDVLPEMGGLAGTGATDVQSGPDGSLEFRGSGWHRTVRLAGTGAALTVEQTTPLPPEKLQTGKKNEVLFRVTRETPNRAVYSIERPPK